MNWMISLTLAIVLTTITGTILFGVWYVIGKILELTGFINVMYELVKAVMVFWMVPVSFIFLNARNIHYWGGFMFMNTPLIGAVCSVFCVAWIAGVIHLLWKYVVDNIKLMKRYKNMFPADGSVLDYFYEICEELRIKEGKVDLVEDSRANGPFICGMRKAYVVLPLREYSREQLRVIFLHELIHYKQKNILLRHITAISNAIHFYNPVMIYFSKKIEKWGEYACDYEAIPRANGVRHYFNVIMSIVEKQSTEHFLNPQLVENEFDLLERVELMKRSYRMKKKSKVFAAFVVAGMVSVSTLTVHGATVAAGDRYYDLYFSTVSDEMETTAQNEEIPGVEYEADGFEPGVIVEEGEVNEKARSSTSFTWTIKGNMARRSSGYKAKSGGTISVSVTTSPSKSIRAGIIEPDGTMRYVNGEGGAYHSFSLDQTGTYYTYVQNMTSSEIAAAGSYSVN